MKNKRAQRGATILEFAIAVPILVLLMMGIIEFARVMGAYQTLTDAAREGCRYAVAPMPGTATLPTTNQIQDVVYTFLDSAGIPRASSTVAVNQTTSVVNGINLTFTDVQVTAPYTFVLLPVGSVTLDTHVVMRNETN